jgi:hypothetical protein
MASAVMGMLTYHAQSRQHMCEVSRLYNVRVVVSEDFARREAVKCVILRKKTTEPIITVAKMNLERVLDMTKLLDTEVIPSSGFSSWWHKSVCLQPDSTMEEAFNDEYIQNLHSELSSSSSSTEGDSVVSLARSLQRNRSKNVILVDGTDSSLLAGMWEETKRNTTNIYLAPSFHPSEGFSISDIRKTIGKIAGTLSPIVWENLLFCFPMLGSVGLPPLLMLQYYYKSNTMTLLAGIIKDVANLIYKNGTIQLATFVPIIEKLASLEKETIGEIHTSCLKYSDTNQYRCLADVGATGWEGFRKYYYMEKIEEMNSSSVAKRVVSYLAGMMQLAEIYQGRTEKTYFASG